MEVFLVPSIHFGEDKTECTLFSKAKNLSELNITYDNNRINQLHMVEYLNCYKDANLSGDPWQWNLLEDQWKVTVLI